MTKMTKVSLTKALRGGLIAILLFVIFIISWYFISHRRSTSVPPLKVGDITPQKVERQEGIEHFDFRGERVIQAKAARHYAGENNRYYLEGNVEIRERREKEKREIFISGDKVSHDKDWTEVFLEGNAKLKYGDLAVESPSFTYEKSMDMLSTDRGVVFSSPKVSGKALKMFYSFKEESVRLEGDVELQLVDKAKSSSPFVMRGDVFTYSRRDKKGKATGSVSFSLSESHGQAESFDFELTEDEQYVRNLWLNGSVKGFLMEEDGGLASEGNPLLLRAKQRQISADEVNLRAFENMPKIQAVEAKGNCYLKSLASSGGLVEVQSDVMNILFDREGGLQEFSALNKANMIERGKDAQVERTMSGDEIFIGEQGAILKVRAGKEGEARVDTRDSEIAAGEISLNPRREILDAKGDVKAILKLQPEKTEAVGFFSNEKPVFITCRGMRYEKEQDRLLLREGIRMWQDKEMLFAEKLEVLKKTGDISGEGSVRAVFPFVPKKEEGKEERIEMGGEKMNLNAKDNLLTYEQNCWLKAQNIDLKSQSLFAYLREKQGEIQKIEAKGNVIITEESREGRGTQALYDLEKETIVLTGNPTLIDKEKGVIEGDKLTFYLGDGKILVENKNRERSVTVIKS
jgi:lipopolysaccharide export system protein LptA